MLQLGEILRRPARVRPEKTAYVAGHSATRQVQNAQLQFLSER